MSAALDLASWTALAAGGFFCLVGGIGLLRMPDFYTRVHAASVAETLGVGLMLLGLMLQSGFTLSTVKLAIIGLLFLFTSPAATNALAKAGMSRGIQPLLASREHESSKR
ncbi:Na(+)/H(+) antiporter subunit G [Burkholderiales bacterium]|nr:Na(+)/H(+) antiporter subunit G [Burkholderiales bacterium]